MMLLIDPSQSDVVRLALFDARVTHEKQFQGKNRELFFFIDAFLAEQGVEKHAVAGIAVVVGEGSFTSTRIAVTVANTFGYVLDIPLLAISKKEAGDPQVLVVKIKKQPVGQYISATYSGKPNIGKKTAISF